MHWPFWRLPLLDPTGAQCGGPQQAVSRLSRRLYKLSAQSHFNVFVSLIQGITKYGNGTLTQPQKTALEEVQRGLKIS
ncbi:hypothetical protein [Pseudophaeobacter sp.]|uniref:hypothetical protein n=1 Tax=Pseudophaeobacter sp. TaxID=1971739 RepID=UPI0025FCD6C3|nr:hypothetical protein [uncultured Pseudophaeobacter sp.]